MYKRILIATDGSDLAQSAIGPGVALAALAQATVVAVHVRVPVSALLHGTGATLVGRETQLVMEERGKEVGREAVARVIEAARAAQVRCEAFDVVDPSPANGILEAARRHDCDLIVMASHGRGAFARALLGSETSKVLAHAKQAVLVCR